MVSHCVALFNKFSGINIVAVILMGMIMSACGGVVMDPYYDYIRTYGYAPYSLPKEKYGPGLVFQGSASSSNIKIDRILCLDVFPMLSPIDIGTKFPSGTSSDKSDIKMGLSLLSNIVGDKGKAEANLTGGGVKKVKISFSGEKDLLYPGEKTMKDGKPRPVDGDCYDYLQGWKEKGKLPDDIYIIEAALYVSGINYHFEKTSEWKASADIGIKNMLSISPSISNVSEKEGNLEVKEPYYVGTKSVLKLKDWAATGQVTGAGRMVSVKADRISVSAGALIEVK